MFRTVKPTFWVGQRARICWERSRASRSPTAYRPLFALRPCTSIDRRSAACAAELRACTKAFLQSAHAQRLGRCVYPKRIARVNECGIAADLLLTDLGIKPLNNRLLSVQALRGIAATAVVMAHSWSTVMGTTGVHLFFIISGFTMVYASKSQFGNRSAVAPFLYRRFLRIYPIYWAATAFFIAVWGLHVKRISSITSLLLVMDNHTPIMDPAWTLIFEVMFYIIFAFLLPVPLRRAL